MPLVETTQTYESKKFRWLQCFGACCICGSPLRPPSRSEKKNTPDSAAMADLSGSSSEEEFAESLDDVTDDLAYDSNVQSTWFFNQVRDPVGTLYSSQGIDMTPQEGHLIEASILFNNRSVKKKENQEQTFTDSVERALKFLYDFDYDQGDRNACLKHYLNMIKDADNYTVFICKECNITMTNASMQFITMTHRIYFLQKSWLDPKKISSNTRQGRGINDNILSIMTFFHLSTTDQNEGQIDTHNTKQISELSMLMLSINHLDFDELSHEMNHLSVDGSTDDYLKNPPDLFNPNLIDTNDTTFASVPVVLKPTPPRQIWKTFSASRTVAHLMAWAEKKTWRQRLVSIFWAAVYIYHTLEYDEMVTLESWYVGVFRPFYDMNYEKNSWFGYLSETAYSTLLPFSYNHSTTTSRQSRQWIYGFLEDTVAARMKPYNDYFFNSDLNALPGDLDEDMCTIQELNRAIDRLFAECSTISDIYSFYYKKLGVPGINAITNWCLTNCSTDRNFTSRIKNALQKIVVLYKLNSKRLKNK